MGWENPQSIANASRILGAMVVVPHAILAGKSTSTNRSSLAKPRDFSRFHLASFFQILTVGPGPQGHCLRSPKKKLESMPKLAKSWGKKKPFTLRLVAQSNHPNKHDLGGS